jgi:hypothetical protein
VVLIIPLKKGTCGITEYHFPYWHSLHFHLLIDTANHNGRAIYGVCRIQPLEHLDCWFETHSEHEVSTFFSCVCIACVDMGRSPS